MSEAKLWNRDYIQLLALEICLQLGLYITRPVISSYAVVLGATLAAAGVLAGLSNGASLALRPFSGNLSDRFDKKTVLVASTAAFVVSSLGCALTQNLWLIGFFIILQGVAFAFKSALVIGLARMVVSKERTGSAIGWLSIAFTIASALGPTIGSAVGDSVGYSACFLISAVILGIGLALAITFRAPEESKAHNISLEKGKKRTAKDILESMFYLPAVPCSLVDGLANAAQGTNVALIFLIATQEGIDGVALYFVIYAVTCAVSRPASGRLNDKYGAIVVAPMFAMAIVGMVILVFTSSFIGVCISAALMGLGQAPIHSVMQAESVRTAKPEEIGRAANTSYVFPDVGMWLGPAIGGAVMGILGGRAVIIVNVLYLIIGLTIALIWMKSRKKEDVKNGEAN